MSVRKGEIHAICGENGAGKSTLMKILSGVYPHGSYGGDVLYDGQERAFADISDSEAVGIIIIHQELALVPMLSITENIFLGNEQSKRGVIDWQVSRCESEGTAGEGRPDGLSGRSQSARSGSASSNSSKLPRRCRKKFVC